MEYFAKNERRADGNTGQAYGRIQSHKKTSLENNKRSARGWISLKARLQQKWKMDGEKVV